LPVHSSHTGVAGFASGPSWQSEVLVRMRIGFGPMMRRWRRHSGSRPQYQARLGKPFLHDAYLSDLTSLRDQFKAGVSTTAQILGHEAGPSVSELAEKIKSLKAEKDNMLAKMASAEARNRIRICWSSAGGVTRASRSSLV